MSDQTSDQTKALLEIAKSLDKVAEGLENIRYSINSEYTDLTDRMSSALGDLGDSISSLNGIAVSIDGLSSAVLELKGKTKTSRSRRKKKK